MGVAVNRDYSTISGPYLQIEGGVKLRGEVILPGAKNSALPSIVAACLSDEEVILDNVPIELNDVKQLIRLLNEGGAQIKVEGKKLICSGNSWSGGNLNEEIANKIRHSLLLLGLSANWRTDLFLPLPGGCDIGNRKHDLHVMALQQMGFSMEENDMGLHLFESTPKEHIEVNFHYPTFGGTLNVLFAAVRSNSIVTLKNAARNPEVIDVIQLLEKMGANIKWISPNDLRIQGVQRLSGTSHSVMSDRIIAATIIAAVGITKGSATIRNATTKVLESEVKVWREAGLTIEEITNGIYVEWNKVLKSVDVTTDAYPGFHTDIQPLHTVLMITADGSSELKETILDGRFTYCYELNKLGANIKVLDGGFICVNGNEGQIAKITGVDYLEGTTVIATDIRGGAAVAVASLGASGISRITNLYQLERGYGNFTEIFTALGASITRLD